MNRWRVTFGLALVLSACSTAQPGSVNVASSIRTVEPSASASAPAGPSVYAVLVDETVAGPEYTLYVVGTDGRAVAKLSAGKRQAPAGALDLPYVSTTSTSLYFINGDSEIDRLPLQPPTVTRKVGVLPFVAANEEAGFAVSPDDTQIAVSVLDFNRSPVHVTLYEGTFPALALHKIFESDSDYIWPVGWHGGLLVLAHAYGVYREVALRAAPARDNPYWAVSYHVVDPATANRAVLMGSCTVSGPLSPAGSACIQGGTIDWQGNVSSAWSTHDWGSISAAASISPDGGLVAAADPDKPDQLDFWRPNGSIAGYVEGLAPYEWAGWLDSTHVFVPATSKYPDRIVTLTPGPSAAMFLDAAGFYAARLPTDIT